MDNPYKAEIIRLLEDASWGGFFKVPVSRVREYQLTLERGRPCLADFCYELSPAGKLFIEDDEAQTALNNLVKYWRWCLQHPEERPVHLVHIIGAASGAWIDHCGFVAERMQNELTGFHYHPMTVNRQYANHEAWIPELKKILTRIVEGPLASLGTAVQ